MEDLNEKVIDIKIEGDRLWINDALKCLVRAQECKRILVVIDGEVILDRESDQ